jgi:hypothetical protein
LKFNSSDECADRGYVAQLSRPYQIALAAVALLGLVWVVALRGHDRGQHESTGSAPAPAPAPSAQAQAKAAAKPTPVYHGAAPGVEGLTRAIAKAHGAVATSQQNAAELAQRSREAANEASPGSPSAASHASATNASRTGTSHGGAAHSSKSAHQPATSAPRNGSHPSTAADRRSMGSPIGHRATGNRTASQVAVEAQVAHGKTVLLLFWNSKSSVDREVRSQTQAMVRSSKGRLALHIAAPSQVGEFGSVTEVAHVFETPTILIVNRHGVVSTLTGLTDTFALGQLVREAQRADK